MSIYEERQKIAINAADICVEALKAAGYDVSTRTYEELIELLMPNLKL